MYTIMLVAIASFVGGELGKAWECFWFEEKQE